MTIAAVLLPALLAGLVQGVTGFGAGVLLMLFYPLLFSVAQSSAMSQCLCTVLCLSVLLRYRRSIRFRHCVLPLVFYFPCYFLALQQAVSMNTDALKPVLGLFLVILSVFLLYGSERIYIKAGGSLGLCLRRPWRRGGRLLRHRRADAGGLLYGHPARQAGIPGHHPVFSFSPPASTAPSCGSGKASSPPTCCPCWLWPPWPCCWARSWAARWWTRSTPPG